MPKTRRRPKPTKPIQASFMPTQVSAPPRSAASELRPAHWPPGAFGLILINSWAGRSDLLHFDGTRFPVLRHCWLAPTGDEACERNPVADGIRSTSCIEAPKERSTDENNLENSLLANMCDNGSPLSVRLPRIRPGRRWICPGRQSRQSQ